MILIKLEPDERKALKTNKGLSIDIHDKIVEWLEKGKDGE